MTTGGAMGGEADVLWVDVRAQTDEQSFRELERTAAEAGDRAGQSAGGKFSAGMTGLVAGAAGALGGIVTQMAAQVGAALANGIAEPLKLAQQARQGVVELQASLGVTGEEAQRLGEVAKTVFGNNWTGSLAEAQAAVANVRREVRGLTDTELQAVTEGSTAIAQRFKEDQQKVATAVQSVMENTGASATEAMDLITAGFQRGLNSSGDWLDTLNEYGPIFKKTGASGAELFSLLETGAAKGALGTDKVADSIKEFGFSLSDTSKGMVQAFADLGLSQSDLTKKIDSGAMTQIQAYQLVQDRLKGVQSQTERMAIISQIFKGAGEDLGAVAGKIDITKTKMSDLSGSTQQVKDSYSTLGSVFQGAWRQVLLQLQPVGDLLLDLANDAMPAVKQAINTLGPVVTQVVQTIVRGFQQARDGVGPIGQAINAVRPTVSALGDLFQSVFGLIASLWQNVLRPALTAIMPVVSTAFQGVSGVLNSALTLISGVINTVAAIFRGDWAQAWEIFKKAATDAANRLQDTLDGIGAKIVEAGGAVFKKAADLGGKIRDGILSGVENLKYALASRVTEAINGILGVIPDWAKNMLGINGPVQMPAKPNTATSTGYNVQDERQVLAGFRNIVAALGLEGSRTGSPYGTRYGYTKADGTYWGGTHNGEDIFAKKGTNVEAAFTGYLTTRWSDTTGNIVELMDAKGQKLLLGHLDGYAKGLKEAIEGAGGKLLVQQGQVIARVGNTGRLTGAGDGNAHIHVMAYTADGKIVDPKRVQFVPIEQTPQARSVIAQPKVGTVTTVIGEQRSDALIERPVPVTVPLPTPAEQKAYSLSLADWNEQSREALAIARQLQEAEVSRDQGFILRVRARAKAYEAEGAAQSASLAFASEQLKKADDAAIASKRARAEAAKKTETVEKESDLQREQRLAREQAAQEALEKSIRSASAARLKGIIAGGVQKEGDLGRINLAEQELERRGQLEQKSREQAKAAREKVTRDELANQQELAERTVKAMQERQARLSRINQLTRQGNIEAARLELSDLERQREADLKNAGESAQARLQVEKSAAQQIYLARKAVLDREKLDRDAAIKNDATLTPALRKLQLGNSQQTYDGLLAVAAQTRADRVTAAEKLVSDAMEKAAENARAAGERQSKSLVDSLKARDKAMEEAAKSAQVKGEQQSDSLLKGLQARDKQLEGQQRAAAQALAGAEKNSADLLKKLRERSLTDYGDFATRYLSIAERMAEGGDYAGSINVLEVAIADLLETSDGSETATAALNKLADALDKVAQARQGLTGDAKSRAEFREAIGTDAGGMTEVVARGQRPVPPAKPDPGVAARQQRPTPEKTTASPARGAQEDWRTPLEQQAALDEAARQYTLSLEGLTLAELEAMKATATRGQYSLIVAQQQRVQEKATADATKANEDMVAAQQAVFDEQAKLADLLDKTNDGPYRGQLDMLTRLGEKYPELADQIQPLIVQYEKLNGLEVTLKIGGIDTGLKQMDVWKSAIQGIGGVVTDTFADMVSGTKSGVDSVLEGMAKMALGIVKQVAVAIAAYQAQAIAMAIISGASFNFVQAGLALAAAAAVAGIAAGLESRIGASGKAGTSTSSGPSSVTPTGQQASSSTNALVTIPTSQVTVMAAPQWTLTMEKAANTMLSAAEKLAAGIRVDVQAKVEGPKAGNLAYDLTTGR